MQRLRIVFARGEGASYLSHLEMLRMWERVLRRAGWRVAHTQGFNPHPRISFASPLPVGIAAESELMEVFLEEPRSPEEALAGLSRQMPPGVEVRQVQEVPVEALSLPRLMAAAEYLAECPVDASREQLRREVERLVAAESLPRERARESKVVRYDLRPLIRSLAVEEGADGILLVRMELRADAQGAGRPDEVLREMGLDAADCRVTRTRLMLEGGRGSGQQDHVAALEGEEGDPEHRRDQYQLPSQDPD